MEQYNKKAITDNLRKYDYLSDENDFIEVTEWKNGEGFTVSIFNKNENKLYDITNGELEAINYLVKSLEYGTSEI